MAQRPTTHSTRQTLTHARTHHTISSLDKSTPSRTSRSSTSRRSQSGTPREQRMESLQPATPTPQRSRKSRKPRSGRKPEQRNLDPAEDTQDDASLEIDPSTEEDDALLDLLGIPAQAVEPLSKGIKPVPGVLHVTKADLEGKPTQSPGKGGRKQRSGKAGQSGLAAKEVEEHTPDTRTQSEGEGGQRRSRRGKPKAPDHDTPSLPPQAISGISATRPKSSNRHQLVDDQPSSDASDAFETASLSQSLPTGKLYAPTPQSSQKKGRSKGKQDAETKGDESAVWDMPGLAGPTQALTWQQKLQSSTNSSSPRHSNKSTPKSQGSVPSERKTRSRPNTVTPQPLSNPPSAMPASPFDRPPNIRRLSLDALPVSAFDNTLPYHTGLNVNRAPQTPVKLPTSMAAKTSLPLLAGEFPRLKGQTSQSGYSSSTSSAVPTPQGIKYAGPTFHNSPAGASLPKPDLEDF